MEEDWQGNTQNVDHSSVRICQTDVFSLHALLFSLQYPHVSVVMFYWWSYQGDEAWVPGQTVILRAGHIPIAAKKKKSSISLRNISAIMHGQKKEVRKRSKGSNNRRRTQKKKARLLFKCSYLPTAARRHHFIFAIHLLTFPRLPPLRLSIKHELNSALPLPIIAPIKNVTWLSLNNTSHSSQQTNPFNRLIYYTILPQRSLALSARKCIKYESNPGHSKGII